MEVRNDVFFLPVAPSIMSRYDAEPYGLVTRAADLRSHNRTGRLMTIQE